MHVERLNSGRHVLEVAGEFLHADEAAGSMVIGFSSVLGEFADAASGVCALAAVHGGRVEGVMLQTAIREAILSLSSDGAARALGQAHAASGEECLGVVGPGGSARVFAGAFAGERGTSHEPERRLLLHRLGTLVWPAGERGTMRVPEPGEVDGLVAWTEGFYEDTRTPAHHRDAAGRTGQAVREGRARVLEVGGRVVSMLHWGRRTRRTRTITLVYTPPELRGRGHAAWLTALASEEFLGDGTREVLLFTDADAPAPNRTYAKVGFAPILEHEHHRIGGDGCTIARGHERG